MTDSEVYDYTITVFGAPVPQPRPKITTRGGFAHGYTPKDHPIHAYRDAIAMEWRSSIKRKASGPLRVRIEFVFERPKAVKETKRPHHVVRPDLTNLAKGVEDCLNGVAWEDDSQIVAIQLSKRYGVPRTVVSVAVVREFAVNPKGDA